MATGFSVDVGALQRAADGVTGTLAQVSAESVSSITCDPAAIGYQPLSDTLSDFLSRWQLGVTNLATDGQQIVTRLQANLQAYQGVEQNLSYSFNKSTAELSGTGADPGER